jgi:hypothetical protein
LSERKARQPEAWTQRESLSDFALDFGSGPSLMSSFDEKDTPLSFQVLPHTR